jgi:hypothetical protein
VDSSGESYISYYDDAAGNLVLAERNEGAWSHESVDTAGTVGEWSSLAIDPEGNPAVSYCDRSNGELKVARKGNPVAAWPPGMVSGLQLRTPAPNPRRGSGPVTLEFATPRDAIVDFTLFDAAGRELRATEPRGFEAGSHRLIWDIGTHKPGVYFVRMQTGTGQAVNTKLVIVP